VAPRPATRTVLGALLHNRQSSKQVCGASLLSLATCYAKLS